MCMESKDCQLRERVEQIDTRVTRLETRMSDGFAAVTNAVTSTNAAVNQLAADFGNRMNTLDARIVEEKARWGESFRRWLDWVLKVILLGCLAAMGMTAYKVVFGA